MKRFLTALLTYVFLASTCFSQVTENSQFANTILEFPDFKDSSVWKGRSSLTRFSDDGKLIAVSSRDNRVTIYDTGSGKEVSKLASGLYKSFSFSPDGKTAVAQTSVTGDYLVFETETGKVIREVNALGKLSYLSKALGDAGLRNNFNGIPSGDTYLEMRRIPISPDWKTLLVNHNDKEFSLVDFETGEKKFDLDHENYSKAWETTKLAMYFVGLLGGIPAGHLLLGSASNAEFSPDGNYVVISNGNKNPTIWDVNTGELKIKYEAEKHIFFTRFSPDSKMLAASDYSGVTNIIDIKTGLEIASFGNKKEKTRVAEWLLDNERIAVTDLKGTNLRVYSIKEGAETYRLEKERSFGPMLSMDRRFSLALPVKNKGVFFEVFDGETGNLVFTVPRKSKKDRLFYAKFSPTGKFLVVSTGLRDPVQLWSTAGKLLQVLEKSTMPVEFSIDEDVFATGGITQNAKIDVGFLWRITDREEQQTRKY